MSAFLGLRNIKNRKAFKMRKASEGRKLEIEATYRKFGSKNCLTRT